MPGIFIEISTFDARKENRKKETQIASLFDQCPYGVAMHRHKTYTIPFATPILYGAATS